MYDLVIFVELRVGESDYFTKRALVVNKYIKRQMLVN